MTDGESDAGRRLLDRARGCLLGLAAGEALGTSVEFRAPGSFAPVTRRPGGRQRFDHAARSRRPLLRRQSPEGDRLRRRQVAHDVSCRRTRGSGIPDRGLGRLAWRDRILETADRLVAGTAGPSPGVVTA